MPKAKTMLDELARVLKARENAVNRTDRRLNKFSRSFTKPKSVSDAYYQARDLERDLSDRAVMEYDRIMRSNPSHRDMKKAWDMLPLRLVQEHDYFGL